MTSTPGQATATATATTATATTATATASTATTGGSGFHALPPVLAGAVARTIAATSPLATSLSAEVTSTLVGVGWNAFGHIDESTQARKALGGAVAAASRKLTVLAEDMGQLSGVVTRSARLIDDGDQDAALDYANLTLPTTGTAG